MKKFASLLAFLLAAPTMAFAQYGPSVVPPTLPNGPYDLVCTVQKVTNWMFTAFLVVAVFFILLAAYYYLLAQGNAEEVQKNHKMLLWSAVAIAVAVLSRGFVTVVQKVVGVNAQEACSAGANPGATYAGGIPPGGAPVGGGAPVSGPVATDKAAINFIRSDSDGKLFSPFNAYTFNCTDKQTPGVYISYSGGTWTNFPDDNAAEGTPGAGNTAMKPRWATAGSISMGVLGIGGGLGIGTGYDFQVQICNDGAVSPVFVDKSKNGSYQRVD